MGTTTANQTELRRKASQARVLRFIQGLSLWTTILLFFLMQSVAARAGEEHGAAEPQHKSVKELKYTPEILQHLTIECL